MLFTNFQKCLISFSFKYRDKDVSVWSQNTDKRETQAPTDNPQSKLWQGCAIQSHDLADSNFELDFVSAVQVTAGPLLVYFAEISGSWEMLLVESHERKRDYKDESGK